MLTFCLSILLLLATPGPTNTLMALAGYQHGWQKAAPLISAELAGYLLIIIPVATLAAPLFEEWPVLALWAKLAAGAWVFFLAIKLWTIQPDAAGARQIDWRSVFVTTCLNPKALIIGLVIMPRGALASLLPWLVVFALLVFGAASVWILGGSLLQHKGESPRTHILIHRIAAIGLLLFATLLAGAGLKAVA
ncbi:threonine/homoserine/homoserine lactone efflux protein [Neorhizobium galegae]|uniref:LysE family translocator n=1 Tax=Neorhizobium galegae TaxID=399 RepID=UPI001AE31A94|nr:threonine/homoserine/homoserine lactone efflux protein [Neorhizobium galegae]